MLAIRTTVKMRAGKTRILMLNGNLKRIIALVFVVLLVLPLPSVVIPEWKIKVLTSEGERASDITIVQEWRSSSVLGFNQDEKVADEKGEVVFPARIVYLPIVVRIGLFLVDLLNFIGAGSPMGGYGIVEADSSTFYLQYVHGRFVHGNDGPNTLLIRSRSKRSLP